MKNLIIRALAGLLASILLVTGVALLGNMPNGKRTDGVFYGATGIHPDATLMTVNMQVEVIYLDGQPFDVELPTFVDLKIDETAAGVRGDTVSGGTKDALLETGARIQVPLFIEPGDVVRVDTRTREYVTRA